MFVNDDVIIKTTSSFSTMPTQSIVNQVGKDIKQADFVCVEAAMETVDVDVMEITAAVTVPVVATVATVVCFSSNSYTQITKFLII